MIPLADIRISVSDGYRLLELTEALDISLAEQRLTTKKQQRYTEATRSGDTAVLKKHVICCPHCEKQVPAYARYADPCFETLSPISRRLSPDTVSAWASLQYSFCPQEVDTLIFNRVYTPRKLVFTCPHCGRKSRESRGSMDVTASAGRGKVTLTCKTHDLGDLLRLPWGRRSKAHPLLPLEERVVFNLNSGKCWISLLSADGSLLAIRNICGCDDWKDSILFRLLEENRRVKKGVAARFRRLWPDALPFSAREITPANLVLLCRHVGFPRSFYARTPFTGGGHLAVRSFRAAVKKLHTPAGLQRMLRQSSLPQVKSLRKRFFLSPEYAFYLPELEFLYGCLGNTDLFSQLFDRSFTFELLAFLHRYPYDPESDSGPGVFLRDYAAVRSPHSLLSRLESRMGEMRIYAIHYSCLSPAGRMREQKTWARETVRCCPVFPYSVPMRGSRIPDTRVDGYDFVLLKTLDDCHKAGAALHNCLKEWEICSNPVFAVKKGDRYLAAIEVLDDRRILQAYAERNMPIDLSPKLCLAYEKWVRMFRLSEYDDEDEEEDPDDRIPHRPRLIPLLENTYF